MFLLAIIALAGWCYLTFLRRDFWRGEPRLPAGARPKPAPDVAIVIPARDEAGTIGDVTRAHLACDYPGAVSVIVVDDASSDGTGEIARAASEATAGRGRGAIRSLEVIEAPPLNTGWTGKLNAVAAGIRASRPADPAYLLLCDADILLAPTTLSRLVASAEKDGLALTSLMARLDARGAWASLLIPAFIYFFQKLYPFPAIADPASGVAGAAGGCMLVRNADLAAAGGIEAIRGKLIDDCALAALLKKGPGGPRRIWLGHAGDSALSLRDNRSPGSIWSMVARTAFAQLEHSWFLLAGCVVGMAILYLMPPIAALAGLVSGRAALCIAGAIGWAMMAWTFAPTVRSYGKPALLAAALPVAGALYVAMTVTSAINHARGEGGRWKGRTYARG
ncbi:MAG: glycosyltransferase [Alphaproteobacteria bacterium]|nr:glycosyltransferase [Alphaproteobacteria bacterium]